MAEVGGYEWSVTCDCGQTINLSGLSTHPTIDYSAHPDNDLLQERIRTIEGMREFSCPKCGDTLRIGVEMGRNDERIGGHVDEIMKMTGPIRDAVESGQLPDSIEKALAGNLDIIQSRLMDIKEEVND